MEISKLSGDSGEMDDFEWPADIVAAAKCRKPPRVGRMVSALTISLLVTALVWQNQTLAATRAHRKTGSLWSLRYDLVSESLEAKPGRLTAALRRLADACRIRADTEADMVMFCLVSAARRAGTIDDLRDQVATLPKEAFPTTLRLLGGE